MKKILTLASILVIFIAGCATAQNTGQPASGAQQANTAAPAMPAAAGKDQCGNPLYPVVDGAKWNYSSPLGDFSHTMKDNGNGQFVVVLETKKGTFDIEGSCKPGGDVSLIEVGNLLSYSGKSKISMKTTKNDGLTLPAKIQTGDEWKQNLEVVVTLGGKDNNLAITNSFKAVGTESVTVPAGTFDTVKIEITSSSGGGEGIKQTAWYAQGVGMVKSVVEAGTPITQELLSYSIPN